MEYRYHLFYVFYILGLMFCFSSMYLYFRRNILQKPKTNIKYYDAICCILLGLFALNILTLFSVVYNIVLFIIFFSFLDWTLYKNNKQYQVWWRHFTKGNYFYLSVIIFIFLGLFFQFKFYNFSITLICLIILSFGFFWQRIKQQGKVGLFIENSNILGKIINWIENFIHNIFYYTYQTGVVIIVIILLIRVILWPIIDPLDWDSCVDNNICKEGNSFVDCGDGKPCTITKEYCLENNYEWIEPIRSCDMNSKTK